MAGYRVGNGDFKVIVEPHDTNKFYTKLFTQYMPAYLSSTPSSDFDFIRSHNNIICSNSSFCWWAAFLSEAESIYTFKPWMNRKGIPLAGIAGAKALDGTFLENEQLARIDWTDYWKVK